MFLLVEHPYWQEYWIVWLVFADLIIFGRFKQHISYVSSSTETVAFQVYEILKVDHEFLQFFWLGSKI